MPPRGARVWCCCAVLCVLCFVCVCARVDSMLLQTARHHVGQEPLPAIWHRYLQKTPENIDLCIVNDDLVGFFNSIPQHRLLDSVQSYMRGNQSMAINLLLSTLKGLETQSTAHSMDSFVEERTD